MAKLMEYKGYHAKVEYDPEDNILIGKVIGIVDSLNFHARNTDELISMFHQSVDNYLELCRKVGKEPEKEYSGTFNVRIPTELHKQAYLRAQQENVALNKVVENALRAYLSSEIDIISKFSEGMAVFADSIHQLSSSISLTMKSDAEEEKEENKHVSWHSGDRNCVYMPSSGSYNIVKVQPTVS